MKMAREKTNNDVAPLHRALKLAKKGFGATSPNPMVGAVLVKGGKIIGQGWHHRAGLPHGEIEALRDAEKKGNNPKGATLYVTLEPCCTHGRTPPCTEAIIKAGIKKVVIGTKDPNPAHAGRAFAILRHAGVEMIEMSQAGRSGSAPYQSLSNECARLNESFNHWIVHRTPFVTVKAAMTLDGKIATRTGESKWITGEKAREHAMHLRLGSDAILVGVNTVIADDPALSIRNAKGKIKDVKRRIILDPQARTPLSAKVVSDEFASLTAIVVSQDAPKNHVAALAKCVNVLIAPHQKSKTKNQKSSIDLRWLLKKLGSENVTSLLVEGGGETNAKFLLGGFAHRVAFFYAPKVLGGRNARHGVGGEGITELSKAIRLRNVEYRWLGQDLLLTGCTS